jgi:hypothetical protein
VEETYDDNKYTIEVRPDEATLFFQSEWERSTSSSPEIAAAISLLVVARTPVYPARQDQRAAATVETPIYPVEQNQKDLATVFGAQASVEDLSTTDGKARIRRTCLIGISTETREDLVRLATTYIGQLRANVTAVVGPITTGTSLQVQRLKGKEAKAIYSTHWWVDRTSETGFISPERIIARQLLCENKVCPPEVLWAALNAASEHRNFLLSELTAENGRSNVAREFFSQQNPVTIRAFRELFARIRADKKSTEKKSDAKLDLPIDVYGVAPLDDEGDNIKQQVDHRSRVPRGDDAALAKRLREGISSFRQRLVNLKADVDSMTSNRQKYASTIPGEDFIMLDALFYGLIGTIQDDYQALEGEFKRFQAEFLPKLPESNLEKQARGKQNKLGLRDRAKIQTEEGRFFQRVRDYDLSASREIGLLSRERELFKASLKKVLSRGHGQSQ